MADDKNIGFVVFMANLYFSGEIVGKWLHSRAPPRGRPAVLHKAKRAASWATRSSFGLTRSGTDQQIKGRVAARKLRIATLLIPKILKFICGPPSTMRARRRV